jgi:uncharacterized protein (TIGR02722 family)
MTAIIRKSIVTCVLTAMMISLGAGCTAFRIRIREQDPEATEPLSANSDQNDLLPWGNMLAEDILQKFPAPAGDRPILVDMGIQNRTRTHIELKALTDTITTRLLDSGRIQLVNAERRDDLLREQGYQLQNCTPETAVQIGKQLGARYMLTGSLVEISHESGRQVRASKQKDVYYQLTVQVTDLETGLIAVQKQRDRLRRASKPIIGW